MTVPLQIACIVGEIGPNGEVPEQWTQLRMPALVVACPRSEAHPCGYDECRVQLNAITTPDEIDGPKQVQARVGWLATLFHDDNLDIIRDNLNAGAVEGARIIGIERDGEDHQENGKQIFSILKLRVDAASES